MIPDTIEYQEALALGTEGFFIFPLHRARYSNGTLLCTCGKDNCDGKHPRVGFSEWATSNKTTIDQYWRNHPESNIGVHLGKSHCFVVDIDGQEGMKEWQDILNKLGLENPETRIVTSGRKDGGTHLYFSRWIKPDIESGILSPNVHVKGNKGNAYVICPPSLHASGSRYTYVSRVTPVDADDKLIGFILSKGNEGKVEWAAPLLGPYNKSRVKYEIPITNLLTTEQLGSLHHEGNLLIGQHPTHPTSDSPREFSIDKSRNRWRCWWHQSGGGLLELAAVMTGLCRCEEFTRDNLIQPLSGKNFARSITAAHTLGIPEDELRNFFGLVIS